MVKVCKRHADNPVKIYYQCVGCELEWFREELEQKQQEIEQYKQFEQKYNEFIKSWEKYQQDIEELEKALREIDTHIRSTHEPIPYIVETLKRMLPEYQEEGGGIELA